MTLRYRFDQAVYYTAKFFLWLLCHSYFRLRVFGREHVPRKDSFLIACSHSSFLDPIMAGVASPRIISYLARETLFRPPLKWAIEHLFAYPISRGSSDPKAFRTVQKLLKKGEALLLFPEGTRTADGSVQHFRSGIGMISHRCQVPIVPVYIQGTFDSWSRLRKWPKPGKIHVYFGKPLMPEDYADYPRDREGFKKIANELENRVKILEKQAKL